MSDLALHVADHESLGCYNASRSLGFARMPPGYALMLNADCSHFYWLRGDGTESVIHWDKWAVYRGACADYADSRKLAAPDTQDMG